MGDLFQPTHLLILFFIAGIGLIPVIFYLLTLQNALKKCDVSVRQMEPGMVWLLLIPLFSLVWNFFVVTGIGKSMGAEFRRRGITTQDPYPSQSMGMTMAICQCCCIIPIVNILAGLIGLALWIAYWTQVANFSRMLDESRSVMTSQLS